jgi:hypothetical protein
MGDVFAAPLSLLKGANVDSLSHTFTHGHASLLLRITAAKGHLILNIIIFLLILHSFLRHVLLPFTQDRDRRGAAIL